jgi:hypothetical protein
MPTKRAPNKAENEDTASQEPVEATTPATPEPPQLPPQVILEGSVALRKITMIIRNGANSMAPYNSIPAFTAHPGMMILLIHAYRANDKEAFIATVQRYLEQAVLHVPHAGTTKEIPARIEALRELIDQIGLQMVAQRMLANIYAPI